MTSIASTWKRVSIIFIATILLSSAVTFNSGYFEVEAKKPGSSTEGPISWSNGFPSGPHSNINIHGKKLNFNCDNDGKGKGANFGGSVFVPIDTQAARDANQAPTNIDNATIGDINFVSNKRSNIEHAVVRDPCSAPFGNVTNGSTGDNSTAALVELPPGEHQVYWRILGNPFKGTGPDKDNTSAMITHPALIDQCNFLPSEFLDGTEVESFDPDAQAALTLVAFDPLEKHTDDGNMTFENTESIYRDNNNDGFVDALDDLLYGSGVALGTPLIGFDASEKHEDETGSTPNVFEAGETIYFDQGTLFTVDAGDIRIANAASQGLSEDVGGDEISCDDETLIGLGLVSNKGAFDLEEGELIRFGDDDNVNEKGKGNKKGKSVAINMTGLFIWSGFVCDATELDGNNDNKLTFEDFDVSGPDGVIDAADIAILNTIPLIGVVFTEATILEAEVAIGGAIDGTIDETEFDVWLDIILDDLTVIFNDDGFAICQEFFNEWVFNVADIVLFGFDYENKGSSLTQLRFYPTATTNFED